VVGNPDPRLRPALLADRAEPRAAAGPGRLARQDGRLPRLDPPQPAAVPSSPGAPAHWAVRVC
jgi:hypothetical protein